MKIKYEIVCENGVSLDGVFESDDDDDKYNLKKIMRLRWSDLYFYSTLGSIY